MLSETNPNTYAQPCELSKLQQQVAELEKLVLEQQQVIVQLRENGKRFQAIFDQTFQFIGLLRPDGIVLEANQTALRFGGISRDEVVGAPFWENYWWTISPQTQARLREAISEAARGTFVRYQVDVLGAAGRVAPIDFSLKPVRNDEGIVTYLIAEGRDMTDQVQRDRDLEEKARLQQIVQHMPILINAFDEQGRMVFWNEECERVTGYLAHEIVNDSNVLEISYPDVAYREVILQQLAEFGNNYRNWEVDLRARDGTIRTISWSNISHAFPIPGWAMWAVGVDVTEQKRMERGLWQSEARYRAIVEDQTEMICRFRPDGTLTFANQSFCRHFGRSFESCVGERFVPPLPDDELERIEEHLGSLNASNPVGTIDYRVLMPNGELRWHRRIDRAILDDQGYIVEFQSVGRDITEHVWAEKEIEMLSQNLARRVAALEAANTELEAFNYSVAHDLRAPIGVIKGFLQLLLKRHVGSMDPKALDYVQRIQNAVQRMTHLIDDLLLLSRTTHSDLRLEQVDLSELAEAIIADLQLREPNRHVTTIVAEHIAVLGDPWLLRVVLENLLDNAWKFTSKQPQACVEFGVIPDGMQYIYFVRDNGAGFDPMQSHKLFQTFQRMHDMSEFPGTGIGLATVQRIIHRHDGQVWAEGVIGQGATIYFTLGIALNQVTSNGSESERSRSILQL